MKRNSGYAWLFLVCLVLAPYLVRHTPSPKASGAVSATTPDAPTAASSYSDRLASGVADIRGASDTAPVNPAPSNTGESNVGCDNASPIQIEARDAHRQGTVDQTSQTMSFQE